MGGPFTREILSLSKDAREWGTSDGRRRSKAHFKHPAIPLIEQVTLDEWATRLVRGYCFLNSENPKYRHDLGDYE